MEATEHLRQPLILQVASSHPHTLTSSHPHTFSLSGLGNGLGNLGSAVLSAAAASQQKTMHPPPPAVSSVNSDIIMQAYLGVQPPQQQQAVNITMDQGVCVFVCTGMLVLVRGTHAYGLHCTHTSNHWQTASPSPYRSVCVPEAA